MNKAVRHDADFERLSVENAELKDRLQELEDTLHSIHTGDVDALIVNNDIYVLESAHAASNRLRQDVLSQMEDAVFAFDNEDHVIFLNAAAERKYGATFSQAVGRRRSEIFLETQLPDRPEARESGSDNRAAGRPASGPDAVAGQRRSGVLSIHRLKDGSEIHVESVVSALTDAAGSVVGTLAVVRDVTKRWRADVRRDALAKLSDRFREIEDGGDAAFEAASILGATLGANRVAYGTVEAGAHAMIFSRGWRAHGVAAREGAVALDERDVFVDELKANHIVAVADASSDPRTASDAEAYRQRGQRSFVRAPVVERGRLVAALFVDGAEARFWSEEDLAFIRDVAERTRYVMEGRRSAEALRQANESLEATVQARTGELMVAEQALRQAQKMEAVGQLTGGIAHDFNNLLASIGASLEVLRAKFRQGRYDGAERYIAMGLDAIKRAAALTQRLLAFARRQTLDPKPTDVNRLVGGMEELIRRTVGPNVVVEVTGADGLWPTRVDASQLESSLLNLCINARDAMQPEGGLLTIETANVSLDEQAGAERELVGGEYISLSVKDSGTGMAPEVIKRVFDPFFTTKPLGQGTGLGLSMVYGFVRQSGGQVRVDSQVGKGTTMCLYLPRYAGTADVVDAGVVHAEDIEPGEGQTVLLIEDENTLRSLVAEVLAEMGYRTITAPDGQAGLLILQSGRRVDLLVTDVGLPGALNGRQVADAARASRPNLKVLFVTGYAESAAVGDGLLGAGMSVLTKPFEMPALARKIKEMIDAPSRP